LAIKLKFERAGASLFRGPFNSVVFERETVREEQGGPVIASLVFHCWTIDGLEFLRLDVLSPVRVTWEGFAGAPSTTGQLHCIDGVAYIDRRMFAVVDRERGDWYLLRERQHQPVLVVQPAT